MIILKAIWRNREGYYEAIVDLGQTEILMREDEATPPGTLTPPRWAVTLPLPSMDVPTESMTTKADCCGECSHDSISDEEYWKTHCRRCGADIPDTLPRKVIECQ